MDYFHYVYIHSQILCHSEKDEEQRGAQIRSLTSFFKYLNMFQIQHFLVYNFQFHKKIP